MTDDEIFVESVRQAEGDFYLTHSPTSISTVRISPDSSSPSAPRSAVHRCTDPWAQLAKEARFSPAPRLVSDNEHAWRIDFIFQWFQSRWRKHEIPTPL